MKGNSSLQYLLRNDRMYLLVINSHEKVEPGNCQEHQSEVDKLSYCEELNWELRTHFLIRASATPHPQPLELQVHGALSPG